MGNIKSCFGPRCQIFSEVIVSVQCVCNCRPLRLRFPELWKTPHMTGGKQHIILELLSLFQVCWEVMDFIWKLNCSLLASEHIYSDHFSNIQSAYHKEFYTFCNFLKVSWGFCRLQIVHWQWMHLEVKKRNSKGWRKYTGTCVDNKSISVLCAQTKPRNSVTIL